MANCWPVLCYFLWFTLTLCSQFDDEDSVAHVYADVGSNVSLPCLPQSLRSTAEFEAGENSQIYWIREGKSMQHSSVETNGILQLTKVSSGDAGVYFCRAEESFAYPDGTMTRNIAQVELHVKTPPPAPAALVVYPSAVLVLITWKVNGTGGYPIKSVTVIYQEVTEDDPNSPSWHRTFPEEVAPNITQVEVYKLLPNTTYRFRVWATNKLGPGDYSEVNATTKTLSTSEDPFKSVGLVHCRAARIRRVHRARLGFFYTTKSKNTFQNFAWFSDAFVCLCVPFLSGLFCVKICRNCRCGKENHSVKDEEDPTARVGRLLLQDDLPEPAQQKQQSRASPNKLDASQKSAISHLAVKYIEQLPLNKQPITGSQAAVDRKRALDRQLPSHDLDPDRCQSLSNKEKRFDKPLRPATRPFRPYDKVEIAFLHLRFP
nr:EOG090X0B8X [Ilyocryptus agilis]